MASPGLTIRYINNFRTGSYRRRPHLDFTMPPGFERRSCLALVLPKSHPLESRIDQLRKMYDPHYYKFPMPHIKLIYPFISCFNGKDINPSNIARIERALKPIEPFTTHLTSLKPFYPSLSQKPQASFSLRPSHTTAPLLGSMQAALRAEFTGEIDSGDPKLSNGVLEPHVKEGEPVPWDPRMSIGRKADLTVEKAQSRFERGIWGIASLKAEDESEARWLGQEWGYPEKTREVTEDEKKLWSDYEGEILGWEVDRVSVLYKPLIGRFKVVEEVMLGDKRKVKLL